MPCSNTSTSKPCHSPTVSLSAWSLMGISPSIQVWLSLNCRSLAKLDLLFMHAWMSILPFGTVVKWSTSHRGKRRALHCLVNLRFSPNWNSCTNLANKQKEPEIKDRKRMTQKQVTEVVKRGTTAATCNGSLFFLVFRLIRSFESRTKRLLF